MHSQKLKTNSLSKANSLTRLAKLARDFRAPASATDTAVFNFLSSLDTPRSLAVWLLFREGEHRQLVDLETNALDYVDAFSFQGAYFATEFLSKSNFLKLDTDRKTVALEKFVKYEQLCKHTNNRFRNLSLDILFKDANVWLLNATQRKISQILGDFSGDELINNADWGPGVSTLLKGESVSASNKFQSEIGITRDLYPLVGSIFMDAYPLWGKHLHRFTDEKGFSFQVGNSVVTVPKNAKTDRVIAIEPGLNLWFQKAIGSVLRRRLKRFGLDLNTQGHNQSLARLGSITGHLATVDFSSASDSISSGVVRELLPPNWHHLMCLTRSSVGILDGQVLKWEKFSSMGNGFTFELESLIFYAAALAVKDYLQAEGEIYVHGDDVVLPASCLELFSDFSAFLGFVVNKEKTHVNSPFRESCGSHYFSGVNCKPIFLKEKLRNVESFYKLANSVRLLAHRCNFNYGCDNRYRRCWISLFSGVPKPLRFGVPLDKGDTGFIVNFDEACPSRLGNGHEGYQFPALVNTGVTQFFEEEGLLLATLWASRTPRLLFAVERDRLLGPLFSVIEPPQEHKNSYTLRGRTRLRIVKTRTVQWYDLGPWA